MSATLRLEAVSLSARVGERAVELLRGIDLAIPPGRALGLVGESGAGKSMIGRLVSGLLPPRFAVTRGRVLFRDQDLAGLPGRERRALLGRRIGFIPQEPLSALNGVRTIGSQMREHLGRAGVPRAGWRRYAVERLAEMRLPDPERILGRYPHELSGGQCQRVLIALAFSGEPDLVVADEPTTALDVLTQARILRLIGDVQARRGTSVLFITHDLRLAAHVCDEVGVLYAGELVELGPARAVLTRPHHPYTRELLLAIPPLAGPRHRLPDLSEHMPGLDEIAALTGCRFAARCPVKDQACREHELPLAAVAPDHWVRCAEGCARAPVAASGPEPPPAPSLIAGPAGDGPLLAFRRVGLRYGGGGLFGRGRGVHALRDVSFELGRGEILGIVGESGSGKSTAGRLAVGLARATSGEIVRPGDTGLDGAAAAQLIFQDPQSALNPRRSVQRLLTQALEATGAGRSERRDTGRRLAAEVGLPGDTLLRYPGQLSGGQKQRVNIGRALCVRPGLIVADEIVSGLDVSVQAHVLNLLADLNRRHGLSILFISHDLAVVRHLCHRLLLFLRGEIVEEGAPDAVFAAPRHPYTRLLLEASPPEDPDRPWPPPEPTDAPSDLEAIVGAMAP